MAKGLLINGAVDISGTVPIPNFDEGWGRINLPNIAASGIPTEYRDQIDVLDNTGEQYTATFGVPNPGQPVKVTLVWSDAPGAVGANPALVNDLDLSVQDGVDTYLGNVFSGGWSATGGTADALNNQENVFIQNPGSSVTITVDATNISGDGVPFSGDTTDQDFALICTNCIAQPDFTIDVTPSPQEVCAPASAVYTVDIGSILGFTNPVTLSAAGNPAGTNVSFSVNPVTPSGTSTMTVTTSGGTPGSYTITVTGTAGANVHSRNADLNLYDAIPTTATLLTPADGAIDVSLTPSYTWTAVPQAGTYEIEVASDPGFTTIVDAATGLTTPDYTGSILSPASQYYWRVRTVNACGTGSDSSTFTFTTVDTTINPPVCVGFESGIFPPYVSTETTSSGNANGRAVVATGNAHTGTYAAQIDTDCDGCGGNTTQAIVLSVNLGGGEPATLDFWIREFSDENNPEDGLFISDDNGASYDRILSFNNFPTSYQNIQVNLAAAAAGVGRTLVDGFLIKFQSNDNFSIPTDGYAIDDICVTGCPAIRLTPSVLPNGVLGAAYSQTVTVMGGTPPHTFSVSAGALPPGLAIDGGTGEIAGTPTAAGTFNFDVTATDANGCSGTVSYSLTVDCGGLTLSPSVLPDGQVGAAYSATVSASGGTPPYTYQVSSGSLPVGLSLDGNTGEIAGTPTAMGTSSFDITATDAVGCRGVGSYTITVSDCPVITITPSNLGDGIEGISYSVFFSATGGTPPYTWSASGNLPPGLSMDPVGELAGLPISAGTFTLDVTVVDASGCTASRGTRVSYTMDVLPAFAFLNGEGHGPSNPNVIRVFNRMAQATGTDFAAYLAGGYGANPSAGDINGAIYDEILTGPGPGPQFGPQLKAFDTSGILLNKVNFYAYGTLRFGVNPASAELEGDGFDEILSGAGPGAVFGPHVRGWNFDGSQIGPMGKINFYAYATLRFGVNVEDGDLDGDGFGELLTGPGPGAVFGAQVKGWNFDGAQLGPIAKVNFVPFSTSYGVHVAGADVEADGYDEIAVTKGAGPANANDFAGYDYDAASVSALQGFTVTPFQTLYGGRVALEDIMGTFTADLVTGAGPDPAAAATVHTYTYNGSTLNLETNAFLPFTTTYGVNVGLGATGHI